MLPCDMFDALREYRSDLAKRNWSLNYRLKAVTSRLKAVANELMNGMNMF